MSDMHNHMGGSSKLDVNLALAIGELKGQMSALSETVNRKVKTDEELSSAVAKLQTIPADIEAMKNSMADMDDRLRAMEASATDRNARQDMVAMILKSPALGWLVGALTIVGGVASGHLQVGVQ